MIQQKRAKRTLTFSLEVSNKWEFIRKTEAAMIVRIASRYDGEIWITKEEERVNAKSIMGIMMLAAAKGTELIFEANCSNANGLKDELSELFASKFQDE